MTLEQLKQRRNELEIAIHQTTNQVYVFQGQMKEIEFYILELEKSGLVNEVDLPIQ